MRAGVTAAVFVSLACPAGAGDLLRGGAGAVSPRRAASAGANAGAAEATRLQTNACDRLARTNQALASVKALQAAARNAAAATTRQPETRTTRRGANLPIVRDGQKSIVLGKGGSRIKAIGAAARKELEGLLECRVHLFLFVKVRDNWLDDPERYRDWGLDFNA